MARIRVPSDIPQRFKKHLRRHVLCQGLVTNSGIRKAINLREVAIVKSPERVGVFLRALNELPFFKCVCHQGTPQGARCRLNGRPPLLVTCWANLPATPPLDQKSKAVREVTEPVLPDDARYIQLVTDGPPPESNPPAASPPHPLTPTRPR